MKLSKFAPQVRRFALCDVVRIGAETWMGHPMGVYRAEGVPQVRGEEQTRAILSLSKKQMDKITLREDDFQSYAQYEAERGMCLNDWQAEDNEAWPMPDSMPMPAGVLALKARNGEMIFLYDALLDPIREDMKEDGATRYMIRKMPNNAPYVAVLNGMFLVAVLLPAEILTAAYVEGLKDFYGLCAQQYDRQRRSMALGKRTESAQH